jgi:hypothetical protein
MEGSIKARNFLLPEFTRKGESFLVEGTDGKPFHPKQYKQPGCLTPAVICF